MPPLLEVKDLRVSYGRLPALTGVDLVVPEGALVAMLGPNGAGSSTLLKAVAGLVGSKGTIMLGGKRIDKQSAHTRAKNGVCLIPEGRGIFPALTVSENLKLALNGNAAEGGNERVFAEFPVLAERRGQMAGTLSGGEQQMLALARAVGSDPALLMADELSLGLAPKIVAQINDVLKALHEKDQRTILMVEQYATHALRVADLVYILGRGKLVWAGEPDELRASKVLVESYLGGSA